MEERWWENGFVWPLDSSGRNCSDHSCCRNFLGWFEMTVIGIVMPSTLQSSIGVLRSSIEAPHHYFYYLFERHSSEKANAAQLNNPTPCFWFGSVTVEPIPEHLNARQHLSAISLFLLEARLSTTCMLALSIRIDWFVSHSPCYSWQSSRFDVTCAFWFLSARNFHDDIGPACLPSFSDFGSTPPASW